MLEVELKRIDPDANIARFYALSIRTNLWGEICLTRQWGRIGGKGRWRDDSFASQAEAEAALEALQRRKERRGYVVTSGPARNGAVRPV